MLKPTVAKIVASFQKTIDKLESVVEASELEVKVYNVKLEQIEEKRAAADIEATRATAVAKKIKALIEPDIFEHIYPTEEDMV